MTTTVARDAMRKGDKTIIAEGTKMIPIYVMGKRYFVPETLTIQKAMEYAGYQFIRSCGCRGGICGACATVYRLEGDYKLYSGLACQTVVQPNMYLVQIPFFPANKVAYDIEKLPYDVTAIQTVYPETFRCVQCNACTKVCPMDLQVMDYMAAAIRGDIEAVAEMSRSCIMCGLCTSRCPGETNQYNLAELCRRLYGRYGQKKSGQVAKRVEEIKAGKYTPMIKELQTIPLEDLKKRYEEREWEPVISERWEPKETKYL